MFKKINENQQHLPRPIRRVMSIDKNDHNIMSPIFLYNIIQLLGDGLCAS